MAFKGKLIDDIVVVWEYTYNKTATNENETGKAWMQVLNRYFKHIGTAWIACPGNGNLRGQSGMTTITPSA